MRLRGQAVYVHDRMTLDEPEISPFYVGYHGWGVSQNIMATYPDGANYTLDVGYFSLYGGERNISWASANGSAITYNCTLPDIYTYGYIPSLSYGLHIGSVSPNITGSLVLGGYDSSRVLTQPPTSTTSSLTLTDISLDVTRGGYAWQNAGSPGPIPNLLRANGSRIASLQVQPRPGVPYMSMTSVCPTPYTPELVGRATASAYEKPQHLYEADAAATAVQEASASREPGELPADVPERDG